MCCQCDTASITNILMVIATFLAVFVALFGERLQKSWFGPKLELKLASLTGEMTKANGVDIRYYHLIAQNRKKTLASNAVVMLTSLDETLEDGKHNHWDGEVPLAWIYPNTDNRFYRTIGAGQKQKCDLIALNSKRLTIQARIFPNNLTAVWQGKCNFFLTTYVKSDETVSEPLTVHIVWDGEWFVDDDEMKNHLIVETEKNSTRSNTKKARKRGASA